MRKPRYLVIVGLVAGALFSAAPVAANETVRWTDTHDIDMTYSCGVIEDTTATIDGTAYFAADGTWLKDIIRFSYAASYTDPLSLRTVEFRTTQVVIADPGTIELLGQGVFIRVPVQGVVLLDVGRLAFDPSDGSTVFETASVLSFEDPTVPGRIDSAVCSLF
jgi:hypothetical protein